MSTVSPIIPPTSPLHIHRMMMTIIFVVKLVVVTKVVSEYVTIIKPFGHHLPSWSLVPLPRVLPIQNFQYPVFSHHAHDLVRLLESHNMVALTENDIGNWIHILKLLLLHVPNNLLYWNPLWTVASFLITIDPKTTLI